MRAVFLSIAIFAGAAAAWLTGSASTVAQTAAPLDVSGKYEVIGQVFGGVVTFKQKGTAVTGSYAPDGSLTGKMGTPTRLDGKFQDQRGVGWFTANFTPDGSSFSGPWGWGGKPPSGHITGKRLKNSS
ncbi:MAG TPA: hypothetical protein VKG44_04370 [Candidatus Baltobacteraceae bacterium]|nr:hypothetical protein [Candidatus Baltobacteraceae bacterium]